MIRKYRKLNKFTLISMAMWIFSSLFCSVSSHAIEPHQTNERKDQQPVYTDSNKSTVDNRNETLALTGPQKNASDDLSTLWKLIVPQDDPAPPVPGPAPTPEPYWIRNPDGDGYIPNPDYEEPNDEEPDTEEILVPNEAIDCETNPDHCVEDEEGNLVANPEFCLLYPEMCHLVTVPSLEPIPMEEDTASIDE